MSERIAIVLTSTMGADAFDLTLPNDVPVQALISKFVRTEDLPFRERDANGNLIPYRLLWKEGNRTLGEAETLEKAGVQSGNTLIMAHEARAGLILVREKLHGI